LSLSETRVWAQFHDTHILITRLPRLWAAFAAGEVGYANMRTAADTARTLAKGNTEGFDHKLFADLDSGLSAKASRLTPSKFRTAARVLRERLHPVDPVERHRDAREGRHTEVEPVNDGMAWWHLYGDAVAIAKVDARMTAGALRQRNVPGETRTLAQLKADAAADVLTGRGTAYEVKTHVQICLPVTALVDEPVMLAEAELNPAVLEGYGPIDQATALLAAADAPSFRRIFTDPIRGIDLNMDRSTYRPTAAQREWLRRRFATCVAPCCSQRTQYSDVDHTTDWHFDGLTNMANLAPLSRAHHTLKHKTRFALKRHSNGKYVWTSPTGYTRENDPPPF
jgi:hypothetical protein